MMKPGKMQNVIDITSTGEQVKMRRNIEHWGSLDTLWTSALEKRNVSSSNFILFSKFTLINSSRNPDGIFQYLYISICSTEMIQ